MTRKNHVFKPKQKEISMKTDDVYNNLLVANDSKLALVVLDGLGDIATESTGFRTPLEAARTPNLDMLAKRSALGRMTPVAPGITPGSGPGHLGLFGYDPLEFEVGRGVIEALGLGIDLKHGDVAARANFCALDAKGIVTDRRAGRIDTKVCEAQVAILAGKIKKIGDVEVIIKAGKGHRFVVVFRGKGLEGPLSDSDPASRRVADRDGETADQIRKGRKNSEDRRRVLQTGPAAGEELQTREWISASRHRAPTENPAL